MTIGHYNGNMSMTKVVMRRLALAALVGVVSGVLAMRAPVVTALPEPMTDSQGSNLEKVEGHFGDIVADPNGAFVLVRSSSDDAENKGAPPSPSVIKIDTGSGARVGSIQLPYSATAIGVSADGTTALLGLRYGTEIWLVDIATMTKTGTITSLPDGMHLGQNDAAVATNRWFPLTATMHGGDAFIAFQESGVGLLGDRRTRILRVDLDDDPLDTNDYLSIVTVAQLNNNGDAPYAMAVNSTGDDLVVFSGDSQRSFSNLVGRLELHDLTTTWTSDQPTANYVDAETLLYTGLKPSCKVLDCNVDVEIIDNGSIIENGSRKEATDQDEWNAYVAVASTLTSPSAATGRTLWSWDENGGSGSQEITTPGGQNKLTALVRDGNYLYLGWDRNPGGITRVDLTSGATVTQTFRDGEGVSDSRIVSMALVNGVIYAGTGAAPGKVMMVPTTNWPEADAYAPTPSAVLGAPGLAAAVDVETSPDGDHLYVMLDQEPIVIQRITTADNKIDATLRLPNYSLIDNWNQQFSIAYDHDAGRAYVDLASAPLKIAVVDLHTMTVVDTISDDSASFAGALAVRSSTNELLVLLSDGATMLGRFDLASGERLADVATTQVVGYADASALTLDASNSALFIAEANFVERIDIDTGTTTYATIDEADVGTDRAEFVEAVASPDGAHVYFLSAANSYHIRIVKIATGDLTDRSMASLVEDLESADYDSPIVAVSPDGTKLYTLTYDSNECGCNNRIVVVDTSTMTRIDSIDVYPISADDIDFETLAISSDGSTGYVINSDPGVVTLFDARTSWTSADIGGFDTLGDGTWASADRIACNAEGECISAGTYDDVDGLRQMFIARSHNGIWTDAEPIPALIEQNAYGVSVVDLDCDGIDTCAIVGTYDSDYTDAQPGRWGEEVVLSFTVVISTDPTSDLYSIGDAAFFTDESVAADELEVPNGWSPVAVDCTLGAGTCAVIGMAILLSPEVDGVQTEHTLPVRRNVSAAGLDTNVTWTTLPEGTVIDDFACNIAPTHCVAVGRYEPDAKNEQGVFEIIGAVEESGTLVVAEAPEFLALDTYNLDPADLMVSCPPVTTPAATTTVDCWLAGSYRSNNSNDDRTPFTAIIGTPPVGDNLIRNVLASEFNQATFPDVPVALQCVTGTACVMAHDVTTSTTVDPSQVWEFGSDTSVEYDRNDRPGYGSAFMSDWTVDVSAFQKGATSDLSCASNDHCVVVGNFGYQLATSSPYVMTKRDGAWGYADRVPGVPYPDFASDEVTPSRWSDVNSVACPAVDACVVVGTVRQGDSGGARAIIVEQHAVTVIVPTPPRNLTVTSADDAATIAWEPPTAGSDSTIDYVITASNSAGEFTCEAESPATQCSLSGLANGDYVATATATNRFGTSWASTPAEFTISVDETDSGGGADSGDETDSGSGADSGGGSDSVTETTTPATTPTSTTPPISESNAPSLAEVLALPTVMLLESPSVMVGGSVELSIGGFNSGDTVRLVVASDPQVLGSAIADGSGTVAVNGVIPLDLSIGDHTLAVIDSDGFGFRQTITVVGAVLPATGLGSTPTLPVLLVVLGIATLLGTRRRTI